MPGVNASITASRMISPTTIAVIMMALRPMVCGRKGQSVGVVWQDGSSLLPAKVEEGLVIGNKQRGSS